MRRFVPSVCGLTVLALALVATFVLRVKADDVWWHLGAGEWMLQHREFPHTNLFSFTAPAFPWVAHEWLAEVLFVLAQRAGPGALVLLATALQVASITAIAWLARGEGTTPGLSAGLIVASAFLLFANFSIRPYLFGNLALLITAIVIERPFFNARPLLLAALFCLWANLHGSFVFGLGLVGLWALFATTQRAWRWLEVIGGVAACALTPNGLEGLLFPLRYLRRPAFLREIMEWQPVSPTSALGLVMLVVLLGALVVVWRSKLRPRWDHLGLMLVFTAGAFSAVRNVALVGIALAIVLPRHLERFAPSRLESLERGASLVTPIIAWLVLAAATLLPSTRPLETWSPAFHPTGLLTHLTSHPHERLFNSYNWGGAFLHSGVPVFIDQRNDCYPGEVFDDYFTVHHVKPDWDSVLDRWRIDAIAWPAQAALTNALDASPRWRVEYEDDDAVLFVRTPAP